jgi:hypothetical protein
MKTLLLATILLLVIVGCTPVRYVNVERKHNYYQRHRSTTYTIPTWIPGRGILLETRIVAPHRKWSKPLPQRAPRRKR